MILNVFDVDHGACALITTSNGRRVMVDCGHHVDSGWYPGAALNKMGVYHLDRLIVTNLDEDHVSGLDELLCKVNVQALITNNTLSAQTIRQIKAVSGMGNGIRRLVESMEVVFTGGPVSVADAVNFGDTTFSFYRNSYNPFSGFIDTNNLSLATFVQCGPHKILFPGDLEGQGWKALLHDFTFVQELSGVTLFIASHHGRLSGYCSEVMDYCPNIEAVVFSDDGILFGTQETAPLYRKHARGILFEGQLRQVLTTRCDKTMQFQFNELGGGQAYLNIAA